jgi:hypothetical protein
MTKKAKDKLIERIIHRIRQESLFVEKSGYTIETTRRILEEEL